MSRTVYNVWSIYKQVSKRVNEYMSFFMPEFLFDVILLLTFVLENSCLNLKTVSETVSHLVYSPTISSKVWGTNFRWFISGPKCSTVVSLSLSYEVFFLRKKVMGPTWKYILVDELRPLFSTIFILCVRWPSILGGLPPEQKDATLKKSPSQSKRTKTVELCST